MVGRAVELEVSKGPARPGRGCPRRPRADRPPTTTARPRVDDVSFQVRAGEILGVAGVQGNGQTELCEALIGLPAGGRAGRCSLDGKDLTHARPRDRLRAGIGYVPEDRQEDGLVPEFSVAENLVLDVYDRPPFASGVALNLDAISANAEDPGRRVRRPDHIHAAAGRHALRRQPAESHPGPGDEPRTCGCCSPASPPAASTSAPIEFVHRRIVEQRDRGVAVLIVSSELDEIYALADRIAVMYEGKIVAFRPPSVPVGELGLLMAGAAVETEGGAGGDSAEDGDSGAAAAGQPDPSEPTAGPS